MTEWKIERMRERCAACERPFADGERVVSTVMESDQDELLRRDVCHDCFGKSPPVGTYWETRFEAPRESSKKKVDFNLLLRLFESWSSKTPPGQEPLLYLIALLLVRKRFFRMLDLVSEGGSELLRLRRPGRDQPVLKVPAPLLRASDLPVLRERLETLLDGSFEDGDLDATGGLPTQRAG